MNNYSDVEEMLTEFESYENNLVGHTEVKHIMKILVINLLHCCIKLFVCCLKYICIINECRLFQQCKEVLLAAHIAEGRRGRARLRAVLALALLLCVAGGCAGGRALLLGA